jgi:hypothetical protein
MTGCFGLFYISEAKNHGFVFDKQIKIRELSVWVIQKHQRSSSFHETTEKEPTVRKAFFFENFKKFENLGSTPKPDFRFFFHPCWVIAYTQVIISKYP